MRIPKMFDLRSDPFEARRGQLQVQRLVRRARPVSVRRAGGRSPVARELQGVSAEAEGGELHRRPDRREADAEGIGRDATAARRSVRRLPCRTGQFSASAAKCSDQGTAGQRQQAVPHPRQADPEVGGGRGAGADRRSLVFRGHEGARRLPVHHLRGAHPDEHRDALVRADDRRLRSQARFQARRHQGDDQRPRAHRSRGRLCLPGAAVRRAAGGHERRRAGDAERRPG